MPADCNALEFFYLLLYFFEKFFLCEGEILMKTSKIPQGEIANNAPICRINIELRGRGRLPREM